MFAGWLDAAVTSGEKRKGVTVVAAAPFLAINRRTPDHD